MQDPERSAARRGRGSEWQDVGRRPGSPPHTGTPGYSGDGGPAANAQLDPGVDELGNTLAVDSAGNLYVADGGNNAVRILRPTNQ